MFEGSWKLDHWEHQSKHGAPPREAYSLPACRLAAVPASFTRKLRRGGASYNSEFFEGQHIPAHDHHNAIHAGRQLCYPQDCARAGFHSADVCRDEASHADRPCRAHRRGHRWWPATTKACGSMSTTPTSPSSSSRRSSYTSSCNSSKPLCCTYCAAPCCAVLGLMLLHVFIYADSTRRGYPAGPA